MSQCLYMTGEALIRRPRRGLASVSLMELGIFAPSKIVLTGPIQVSGTPEASILRFSYHSIRYALVPSYIAGAGSTVPRVE